MPSSLTNDSITITSGERLHIGGTIVLPDATNQLITRPLSTGEYEISPSFFNNPPVNETEVDYYPPIACFTNHDGSEQLTITAQGNVIIGSLMTELGDAPLSPDAKLYVNGKAFAAQIVADSLESADITVTSLESANIRQISSVALKENIKELSSHEAGELLRALKPVKYSYKADQAQTLHAGFLSEDAPDLVTGPRKEAIYPVDIVAILTKAVQDQRQTTLALADVVDRQQRVIDQQQQAIRQMQENINLLEEKFQNKPWFR
jgi:hypothetical protein